MNFIRFTKILIAIVLVVWQLEASGQNTKPLDRLQPARIVGRYSLTSTPQFEFHDPTAWRLLASNDGGSNWTVLDVETNRSFSERSQRQTFLIQRRPFRAYSTYRLQIDARNSTNLNLDMSLQLAGFDLSGPMINVPYQSKLQSIVSASCAHPVTGPAEFAFDDDPTTPWSDFGLGSPGGCWLQVHYALSSKVVITNLSQVTLLTHVSAAQAQLTDGGLRVLSNLTSQAVGPQRLVGYALTSANDEPGRDPCNWELLGSNDGGKKWSVLETRTNEIFADRIERRIFTLTNAAPFRLFRLQINGTLATNNDCQIAEIEPLYADPQASAKYTLVVGAIADNPPLESTEMAFDGDSRSKWFCFVMPSPSAPAWVQWQLAPREEELPVINQRQLDLLSGRLLLNQLLGDTNPIKVSLTGYAMTSAADHQDRDPSNWKLLGSNDSGRSWDVLDSRHHEVFGSRNLRRVFSLPHPAVYQTFRLQIDSVFSPSNAFAVQLERLEPLLEDVKSPPLVLLASSQSENSPLETLDQLFAGVGTNKWLDYSTASTNHASWVEWHYGRGTAAGVINLNREQAAQSLTPQIFELRLPATVLFTDRARAMAGLGDATGFQWVHLDPWPEALVPGTQMVLTGEPKIKGGSLFVAKARLEAVRPLPSAGQAHDGQFYSLDSVTGRVGGVFSGPSYSGATLMVGKGESLVARFPGARFPVPPNLVCPVKINGVVEDLIAGGRHVPSVIWVANPDDIVLAPETEDDWNKLPDFSGLGPLLGPVRLRGSLEQTRPGGPDFIEAGTNRIEMALRAPPGFNAGSPLEAAGMLASERGHLVLHNALLRAAGPARTEPPPLLTRIRDVNQFMSRGTNGMAGVMIRGVITFIDLNMGEFYLQEGDDGLLVDGQLNAGLSPKLSEEGSYVELHGEVQAGSLYATAFARVLGKGRLPEPVSASWDNLMSGALDNRWVEVEGVITSAEKQRIVVSVAGDRLMAWINELDDITARSLVGSVVRVRGVCVPVLNVHDQRIGVRMLVPSADCIDVLNLMPERPFDLPLVSMVAVLSTDFGAADTQQRYVRTHGVVTCKQGRLLFLQDEVEGMRVTLRNDADAGPGDVVEAVGLPRPDGLSLQLIQAVIRKTGRAALPPAVPVDLAQFNIGELAVQQDAMRVEMEGILVNESADATRRILNLRSDQARQVFSAYLPVGGAAIPVGSRLRIQGVFKALKHETPDVGQTATAFEIYVDSVQDINVLDRPSWWTVRHMLALTGAFGGVGAAGLAWIWLLRKQVRQRTRDLAFKVDELRRSEISLAAEVAERKRLQADADQAHNQLLGVARQAGMAEVATNVLHNVGNVLNSVNVSAALVSEIIRRSTVAYVRKAASLLETHAGDLGEFMTKDPQGRQLPAFLSQLAGQLAGEQAKATSELDLLGRNIEHIKEIVAMQQTYAKFAGVTETIKVSDLVEDALRLNAGALARHDIKLIREYAPLPPLTVEKHKVLQILVNLLRNAKYACDESGSGAKTITMQIAAAPAGIRVSVVDNGVGISPDNLTRIFNHGFTTRQGGHGFGLHSGALTARELGGSLTVHSAGEGLGATFTLILPLQPPHPNK